MEGGWVVGVRLPKYPLALFKEKKRPGPRGFAGYKGGERWRNEQVPQDMVVIGPATVIWRE